METAQEGQSGRLTQQPAACLHHSGEGWHNNHHRYQSAPRNRSYWYEIDPTYYGLKPLSWTGFIRDLKPVQVSVLEQGGRIDRGE